MISFCENNANFPILQDKAEIEKEFQLKCESFQTRIKELEGKESQLVSEMKKKSDTARQLLISKDKEIDQLKSKLSAFLNANKDNNNSSAEPEVKEQKESIPLPPPISTPQKEPQQQDGSHHKSSVDHHTQAVPSTPSHQHQQAVTLAVDDILSLEEVSFATI